MVYIYMCVCVCMYVCLYIYTYLPTYLHTRAYRLSRGVGRAGETNPRFLINTAPDFRKHPFRNGPILDTLRRKS